MFRVGDKVVYPMHGAGVIEAVEEREVLGQSRQYYVLRLALGEMQVMIPVTSGAALGLREVSEGGEVESVFRGPQDWTRLGGSNWNRRYRANLEKMKSGGICQVAEVVGSLSYRNKEKGLSAGERRMLENARRILISELALARGTEQNQIETWLDRLLA